MRLNTDFVRPKETVRWTNDETKEEHIYYKLASSLDNFVLSGSAERAFFEISRDPKTHLLIRGINNISSQDVEKRLSRYNLGVKGMIIPQQRVEVLQGLENDFIQVYQTYFKSTQVDKGQSFAVKSLINLDGKRYGKRVERIDYVISPAQPEFYEILEALGAPENLVLD